MFNLLTPNGGQELLHLALALPTRARVQSVRMQRSAGMHGAGVGGGDSRSAWRKRQSASQGCGGQGTHTDSPMVNGQLRKVLVTVYTQFPWADTSVGTSKETHEHAARKLSHEGSFPWCMTASVIPSVEGIRPCQREMQAPEYARMATSAS
jgi:hypothetical protein